MLEELTAFGRFLVEMGSAEQDARKGSARWQAICIGYAASLTRDIPRNRHERRAQKARAR